jgi:hypothetical protein
MLAAYPVFFAVIFLLSLALQPNPRGLGTHTQLGLPPCGLYRSTGIPCPSCGMTTAFAWMARGRVLRAVSAHPFGAFAFAAGLAVCVASLWALIRGRSLLDWLGRRSFGLWGTLLVLLALGSWVLKLALTL